MSATKKAKSVTPLMKQYADIKSKHPDALLLFRVGDFYETFGQDAIKASKVLGIVLTKRHNGSAGQVELAGFPHHSIDTYLPKLVRSGLRVAICDQLEDPKQTKTIVKRGVTELVTPGVSYNDQVLEQKKNNFLASIFMEKDAAGIAFLDVSTGEFFVTEGNYDFVDKLIQSLSPSEVIYEKGKRDKFNERYGSQFYSYPIDDWVYSSEYAQESLTTHFGTSSLKGFGIADLKLAIIAASAALHYLKETQHNRVQHLHSISRLASDHYLWMDRFTIRNLELLSSPHSEATTLVDILDQTISPMGSRMLKRWITLPLKDIKAINHRLESVAYLLRQEELHHFLSNEIAKMGDLERLIAKVAVGRVNPREMVQLKRSLLALGEIKKQLSKQGKSEVSKLGSNLKLCDELIERINFELEEEPSLAIGKGNVIKSGFNAELDELRSLKRSGKEKLMQIQKREAELTGIGSLKIAYNNVFGYYIEVRNSQKEKVPYNWIRKQTLVNAERYITEELKEYESKILGAEDKILILEQELFNRLVNSSLEYIPVLQSNASIIAKLDCLMSFAKIASDNNYTRPKINTTKVIEIKDGRHPVIERQLPMGEDYITNDVYLNDSSQQIMMITGPNMSGKSALLRQTALIVLMAQMGSFVPCTHAAIGLTDKIFTRVGASDNISSGESTFMVEMNETASILNNISDRSLILLDEIGRGTSTYDGISIAWAIAEYLHESHEKPKTLFATHYHELNEMSAQFDRIKNFNVSVKETDKTVLFLRKLKAGGSEHSFGIHVAKMAGMPSVLLRRANEILGQLESKRTEYKSEQATPLAASDMQLSFFQLDDPVLEQIRDELLSIDINSLTPVEALMKLNEIKKMVGGKD